MRKYSIDAKGSKQALYKLRLKTTCEELLSRVRKFQDSFPVIVVEQGGVGGGGELLWKEEINIFMRWQTDSNFILKKKKKKKNQKMSALEVVHQEPQESEQSTLQLLENGF